MNLFNNIFRNSEEENTSNVDWLRLTDLTQLEDLTQLSFKNPVLIFKHSTRCSISRFALKQFEKEYAFSNDELTPYFLDLLEYRGISNEIATRFGVYHQSPQILVIKEGMSIYDESHDGIAISKVKQVLM